MPWNMRRRWTNISGRRRLSQRPSVHVQIPGRRLTFPGGSTRVFPAPCPKMVLNHDPLGAVEPVKKGTFAIARYWQKKAPRKAGLRSSTYCRDQPWAAFATSAAKSSSFFSIPSPTSIRTKPVISTPASLAAASTVRSGLMTKA